MAGIGPASGRGSYGVWARGWAWRCRLKIEILYFDGCPTYSEAEKTLRKVLARQGAEAEVDRHEIDPDEGARRFRFPGIPTIRVDGPAVFPSFAAEREDWRLGCRIYATPEGLKGSPTAGMLEEALERD